MTNHHDAAPLYSLVSLYLSLPLLPPPSHCHANTCTPVASDSFTVYICKDNTKATYTIIMTTSLSSLSRARARARALSRSLSLSLSHTHSLTPSLLCVCHTLSLYGSFLKCSKTLSYLGMRLSMTFLASPTLSFRCVCICVYLCVRVCLWLYICAHTRISMNIVMCTYIYVYIDYIHTHKEYDISVITDPFLQVCVYLCDVWFICAYV